MMTGIERWFNRHSLEYTLLKMKEWGSDSLYDFFEEIFNRKISDKEIEILLDIQDKQLENEIDVI